MGYQRVDGKYGNTDPVTLFPLGTLTASGAGNAMETDRASVSLLLNITAASGTTPTLDLQIQTRRDGNDTWRAVGAFAQQTGVGAVRASFAALDRNVRCVPVLGGTTPSFTFSVDGEFR